MATVLSIFLIKALIDLTNGRKEPSFSPCRNQTHSLSIQGFKGSPSVRRALDAKLEQSFLSNSSLRDHKKSGA